MPSQKFLVIRFYVCGMHEGKMLDCFSNLLSVWENKLIKFNTANGQKKAKPYKNVHKDNENIVKFDFTARCLLIATNLNV